tara:strand:+ start:18956 stop:19291 length:336 start_codon:yes stop_codon:yes gene_type:complete
MERLRSARCPAQACAWGDKPGAECSSVAGRSGPSKHTTASIALQLSADGRGRPVNQASNAAQAEALSLTELNDGALFDAEFGIGHRGSTVPERSGVALSFRGRPFHGRPLR